jgi:hypothetical protein
MSTCVYLKNMNQKILNVKKKNYTIMLSIHGTLDKKPRPMTKKKNELQKRSKVLQQRKLIIPALSTRICNVQCSLGRPESKRRRGTSNGTASKCGGPLMYSYHINQKVLARKVCYISANKKPCRATNGHGKGCIVFAIIISWLLDAGENSWQKCSSSTQTKIKGGPATNPSSCKYSGEGQI